MHRPSATASFPDPKPLADCRLYAFVDTAYLDGRDPCKVAGELCSGGADIIQLRAKAETPAQIQILAERLVPITGPAGVWLIINDHADVAAAVGAPGFHLGQEDWDERGAGILGTQAPDKPLSFGLSTHAPEQAMRAVAVGAHYLGVGPVFATPTKPTAPAVGLEYVRWAASNIAIPWFAIGGITMDNVGAVLDAGARGICVVSAILRAPNITAACRSFREKLIN